tara:strand:- start:32284 stop:33369 length:1086 start_codon:yes stop_codon:yes gene_type:complete
MSKEFRKDIRGRGASSNIANRFLSTHFEATEEDHDNYLLEEERSMLQTELIKDTSRTIITKNNSPDVGFDFSINCYRGCEHGCAYCYARPTHEYLGYSAGLDFETKIHVKYEAPQLLREALMKKSWEGQPLFMSGVTDCYQPIERKLKLTRGCLEVLNQFKNPVAMITKNSLVTRDIDILQEMAEWNGCVVFLSITTLDTDLARSLEPRTSTPAAKLAAIAKLSAAGIPTGVNVAPVIPGLTDQEVPLILKAANEAGAQMAGFGMLRMPGAVLPVFQEWVQIHRPLRYEKIMNAVRDIRDGELNSSEFGDRMRGSGPRAEHIRNLFKLTTRKLGLNKMDIELCSAHFKRPPQIGDQLAFDV